MSSSTSISEPAAWARVLRFYVVACAILGCVSAGVLIGLDPYDSGRLAVVEGYGVPASFGPRLAAASVARAPDAEAAIIGNSTIQLLDPARLAKRTGSHFVSLAIAGTGPVEQLAVARWFLRHHQQPKALVFDLDQHWCQGDGALTMVNPFPFWLYSASVVDYAVNMLRLKNFESAERKLKLMLGRAAPLRADGYRDYETGHDWNEAAAEQAFAEPETGGATPDPPDFAAVPLLRGFFAELWRGTDVVLVFPPRHHSSLPPADSAAARVEAQCKAAFAGLAAVRAHTVVVDLAVDGDIARDDRDFWDKVHYRGPVARLIEDDIATALGGL